MTPSRMLSIGALVRAGAVAVVSALAAACADAPSVPVQPVPAGATPASAVRLVCTANVASRSMSCDAPGAEGGPRADRILGQGGGMKLTSSNIAIVADSFMFDVTVTNQLDYPVGTTDGSSADPNGIRVFFADGIHTTGGTGSVTVANADGVGVFTAAGQAYFAYVGVLQPAATTPAKRWKLRFDPGVTTFSFILYISTPVPPGGGSVWMTMVQPAASALVGNSVAIRVRVDSSTAAVQTVRATIADRTVLLTQVFAGTWDGTLNLAGLPAGVVDLRVRAFTVHADSGVAVRPLTKDAPPVVTVAYPSNGVVARPNLRIDADCSDDDPAGCANLTATVRGAQTPLDFTAPGADIITANVASGTSGIHTDVSLTAFNDRYLRIDIRGADSRGQAVTVRVEGYAQANAALTFVDSAGRLAMDVDSARLLFQDASNRVALRDRSSSVRTVLLDSLADPTGWLHAQGAFFGPATGAGQAYDWRGTLFPLGPASSGTLRVKGDWAVWSNGATLNRRDLATGTTAAVSSSLAGLPDVAANGDVAFRVGYDVYRYRAGTTTAVTADVDSAHWNLDPVTDGINVVYIKSDQHNKPTLQPAHVAFWNGTVETLLTDTMRNARYAANNGWIAFQVKDDARYLQLRVRAPDGTYRWATSGAESSYPVALASDGTLVYTSTSGLYVIRAPYTGARTRLGTFLLRPEFRGTELLLFIGNTAFRATY